VQTTSPEAEAIATAARHDSEGFLAGELARRRALRYPPFADLVRVVASAEEGDPARAAGERIAAGIRGAVGEATEVLGPAPLFRLRGRDRWQVVVKTAERPAAVRATGAAVEAAARDRALRAVTLSVDVDPQ
jgi:primosomal protein N' (replication factor Y) (superfamily II helicase)